MTPLRHYRVNRATLLAQLEACRKGLFHRITGWDKDGQTPSALIDEMQELRDQRDKFEDRCSFLNSQLEKAINRGRQYLQEIDIIRAERDALLAGLAAVPPVPPPDHSRYDTDHPRFDNDDKCAAVPGPATEPGE